MGDRSDFRNGCRTDMEGRPDAGKHSVPKAASRVRFLPDDVTDGGQEIAIFEESQKRTKVEARIVGGSNMSSLENGP